MDVPAINSIHGYRKKTSVRYDTTCCCIRIGLLVDLRCLTVRLLFFGFWQVKVAVQYMRKVIQKKAAFDIMDLDTIQVCMLQRIKGCCLGASQKHEI